MKKLNSVILPFASLELYSCSSAVCVAKLTELTLLLGLPRRC